ncbi:hypothetical protein MMIC_P0803 [Mariprofundus micogutta]|uniref:Ancillary SecYEG translocon subunit/Cell division coordinator CpoB TPR domain-containing protein n=1 Tax=Mariprofundus micogutta TaxID=1921010 RepID=A0A1L8CLS7_9PROT|nr:tetratricopeptide repeat protein [Mariprofundus micogutta]GAV19845.1 hypothetical protein MMIC_P0803 [Mariprofundus micogutta]
MTDKTEDKTPVKQEDQSAFEAEMEELKREMRSAKWVEWAENNQKTLMLAAGVLIAVLMAGGLWIENDKAQRATAGAMYQQAANATDRTEKQALMEGLLKDFGSSSYGALALMQLANVDIANRETHLKALMAHPSAMQEWVWEARLDLAALKIEQGDNAAAMQQLEGQFGTQYQQLRHYLMAQASEDAAEKQKHLQQSLDASPVDNNLKQKVESLLAKKVS